MYTVRPEGFDPVRTLAAHWLNISKRAPIGTNQKAVARDEGLKMGEFKGIAESLAWFLTVRRVERYGKFDYIAAVDLRACEKFLQDYIAADEATYSPLLTKVNEEGYDDLVIQADLDFNSWYDAALNNLVYPHDMEELEKDRHHEAVLTGTEKATAADTDWLEKLRDEHDQRRAKIEDIYAGIPTQS